MQFNLKEIALKTNSRNQWISIIPIGDIHLGNVGCDIDKLKETVEYIRDKKCYWIGMGDYIEAINYTDPRFDPHTIDSALIKTKDIDKIVQIQIEKIVEILKPIAHFGLGLHRGNHEEKIRTHHHYDVLYEMWRALRVPLLYDVAITRLLFKCRTSESHIFDVFSTHGNVGGRKSGAKANRLEDLMHFYDADIYLMAHSHIKLVDVKNLLYHDRGNNLQTKKKIMGVTGSFLKGYNENQTSYIEKWNFPPTDTGVIHIKINPRKQDIHASV